MFLYILHFLLKQVFIILCIRSLRKWVAGRQNPVAAPGNHTSQSSGRPQPSTSSRPRSTSTSDSTGQHKAGKDQDNTASRDRTYRERQKQWQQQHFAQLNQNEYKEFLQIKVTLETNIKGLLLIQTSKHLKHFHENVKKCCLTKAF